MTTDPADLSAIAARELIGRRALSPLELAEACIARAEGVMDFERMWDEAKAAEAKVMAGEPLGLLHGLPLGVKDMTDVAGLPTTYGCTLFRDNLAAADDPMVAALRQAGAVVLLVPRPMHGSSTRPAKRDLGGGESPENLENIRPSRI